MGKIVARDSAFKLVYQNLFNKEAEVSDFFAEFELPADEQDKEYALSVYDKVVEQYDEIVDILKNHIKEGYEINRIYKLDLAILLVALCEIKFFNQDAPLIVNEAVELAKKYSTDKSPAFVNGVLGGFVRSLN